HDALPIYIRALRHVAHVAEVAVIDDVPVDLLVDGLDLTRARLVHRIEQRGKRVAQVEAAATAVTDIEDALELLEERLLVQELGIFPRNRMASRRLYAAFAGGRTCGWLGHAAFLLLAEAGGWRLEPEMARARARPLAAARTARGGETSVFLPRPPASGPQPSKLGFDYSVSSAFWKRFACERSAFASVSNQSAISSNPSSRACFAMPGYMSVYSCVSPAIAAFRFAAVSPIGRPVAGAPTASRYSRCPWAWPVSPSAVERNTAATSL